MTRIIPRPQKARFGTGSLPLSACRIIKGTVADSAAVREFFESRISSVDRAHFAGTAGDQAYFLAIEKLPTPRVIYGAAAPQGLRYAEATLRQLCTASPGGDRVPLVEIVDWPDFEVRLNNWLLWAEITSWSYDRGDGVNAFLRRAKEKLRMAADYKINGVLVDGFGWNAERFPGYGKMMRELNAYARSLGIHLMYSGYGSGYGSGPSYGGTAFQNRASYPDGEVYACCGHPERGGDRSRYMGTCLSNDVLMKLKQEELGRFVANVHPGALYIHNLDLGVFEPTRKSWLLRCPKCRERWPDDDALSPNGAAGAYAHHYDSLTDAVFGVQDVALGYQARRDCYVVHVSPAYGDYSCTDKEWDEIRIFYAAVSRCMRNVDNVLFGMREQWVRRDGPALRLEQLAETIRTDGKGQGVCVIVFCGGDGFINDHLLTGAPSLSGFYRGSRLLMNCAGNAYQEPLQLMNGEYAWNSSQVQLPGDYEKCKKVFGQFRDRKKRPESIFGHNGFLGAACARLYGAAAGREMEKVFNLATRDQRSPVAHITTKSYGALGNPSADPFPRWGDDLPEKELKKHAIGWERVAEVTRQAASAARAAAAKARGTSSIADLKWYAKSLETGRLYAEAGQRFYQLYALAQKRLAGKSKVGDAEIAKAHRAVLLLTGKMKADLRASFPGKMIDYMGGDRRQREKAMEFIIQQAAEILEGSKTGKRGEKSRRIWW